MGCRVTPVGPQCLWSKGMPGDSDLGEGRTCRHSVELWGCGGPSAVGWQGRREGRTSPIAGEGGRRERDAEHPVKANPLPSP